MRFIVVTAGITRPELEEAITHLRGKQRLARIQSTRDEIAADIDELLEMLATAL